MQACNAGRIHCEWINVASSVNQTSRQTYQTGRKYSISSSVCELRLVCVVSNQWALRQKRRPCFQSPDPNKLMTCPLTGGAPRMAKSVSLMPGPRALPLVGSVLEYKLGESILLPVSLKLRVSIGKKAKVDWARFPQG